MMKAIRILLLVLALFVSCQEEKDQPISNEHRCANCGMLTAKYHSWEQMMVVKAGDTLWFDGARCMFRVYLDKKIMTTEPAEIQVKDYYDQIYIDGRQAYYVVGSDVFGPMGHELVPFKSQDAAKSFLSDHHGRRILRFDQVDLALVKDLAGSMGM